jgi:hypothetical protein
MHPFEILLTDKLPGTCLVAPYLAELSCDAEKGAGGVCFFFGGEIPTSIATRFFITKYHPHP